MTAPDVQTPGGNRASTNQKTDDAQIIGHAVTDGSKPTAALLAELVLRTVQPDLRAVRQMLMQIGGTQ